MERVPFTINGMFDKKSWEISSFKSGEKEGTFNSPITSDDDESSRNTKIEAAAAQLRDTLSGSESVAVTTNEGEPVAVTTTEGESVAVTTSQGGRRTARKQRRQRRRSNRRRRQSRKH
jgi:hypothetical protein